MWDAEREIISSLFNPSLYSCTVSMLAFMIQRARERLGNRAVLKAGRAEDLFRDNEFDLVLFINTLEFLEDPLSASKKPEECQTRVFIGVTNSLSWYFLYTKCSPASQAFFRSFCLFQSLAVEVLHPEAYGSVPVQWRCSHIRSPLLERMGAFVSAVGSPERCPFGSFSLCVPLRYTLRTSSNLTSAWQGKASVVEGDHGKCPSEQESREMKKLPV